MTLARSVAVGVLATAVDVAVLLVLVSGCAVPPTLANVPSLLAGVAVQFLGNKYWAFRDRSRDLLRQSALFGFVEAGTFVLNAAAFHVLVAGLDVPYGIARPLGTLAVYLLFSYPLWARIFTPADARRGRGSRRSGTPAPAR